MKILVLMPLDEKWSYVAQQLYMALPNEVKDKTFPMPMYMDYLMTIKLSNNWETALFDAAYSATAIYNSTDDEEDMIVIGNMPKTYKFDVVFNFQNEEEPLDYQDLFVPKVAEKINANADLTAEEKEHLLSYITNYYTNADSKMSLCNAVASADFLAAYLTTDPKLDKLKAEYEKRREELILMQKGKKQREKYV